MGSFSGSLTSPKRPAGFDMPFVGSTWDSGWMVGANPKNHGRNVARRTALPDANVRVRRWRWAGLACAFVPLSVLLVQCGRAPNPSALAANASDTSTPAATGDTFDDRFP